MAREAELRKGLHPAVMTDPESKEKLREITEAVEEFKAMQPEQNFDTLRNKVWGQHFGEVGVERDSRDLRIEVQATLDQKDFKLEYYRNEPCSSCKGKGC